MGDAADMCTEQGMEELSLHERGECDDLNPCRLCDPEPYDPEHDVPLPTSYKALQEALGRSITALDDWLNTYASEFCHEYRVAEAGKRIRNNGGTLAYIADVQAQNRKALGIKLPTNGERMAQEKK